MPQYTYECDNYHREDVYYRMSDARPKKIDCPRCGRKMVRIYLPPQVSVMEPYITEVGDGKPKQVTSPAQEREIERKYGVAHLMESDLSRMRERAMSRGQKKRIAQRAKKQSLKPMKEHYERAEASVKQMGTEYIKEQEGARKQAAQEVQRDIERGFATG